MIQTRPGRTLPLPVRDLLALQAWQHTPAGAKICAQPPLRRMLTALDARYNELLALQGQLRADLDHAYSVVLTHDQLSAFLDRESSFCAGLQHRGEVTSSDVDAAADLLSEALIGETWCRDAASLHEERAFYARFSLAARAASYTFLNDMGTESRDRP